MDLAKNYPWSGNLKISAEDFKKWQSENTEDSFVFWSLKNKVINKNQYFDWAMEYYQIPFLEDMFFEQYLITKKQWKEIKDLSKWTEEMMPVAVWDNMIFIGCLEPPEQEKNFNFEHRFVLVSNMALQLTWKFTKELSKVVEKEEEITQSKQTMETHQEIDNTNDFITESKTHSVTNAVGDLKKAEQSKSLKEENKKFQSKAFTPETPVEEKHPLITPVIGQPPIQSSKENKSEDPIKEQDYKIKINSQVPKAETSLPEIEEERNTDSENSTFPGRSHENDNLIMGNFKQNTSDEQAVSQEDLKTETTCTNILHLQPEQDKNYENLWKQTKFVFCTSMVLKVKENKISLLAWSGRMKINKVSEELADLNDHSLFKVVQRGHPYHGFVVETSANRRFFDKIGWENYPKHITAIPIKNEEQGLKQIFAGLSTSPLSKEKIKKVEKIISDFFQSGEQKLSMAA